MGGVKRERGRREVDIDLLNAHGALPLMRRTRFIKWASFAAAKSVCA